MKESKMENSVRNLSNLYTVVIGVALSMAVMELLGSDDKLASITLSKLFLFFSFIIILFPFYHGALRHLDDAYIEEENSHIKKWTLLVDILLLVGHGMVFVVLSLLITKPSQFIWILLGLLAVDVIWGAIVFHWSSSKDHTTEGKWAGINATFVIAGIFYLVYQKIGFNEAHNVDYLPAIILISCAIRTTLDYLLCHGFYFPNE